ncbi:MAG: methyl-accepting chemotaxis protein [Halofilum sp. (in: g-proteobacteria)]
MPNLKVGSALRAIRNPVVLLSVLLVALLTGMVAAFLYAQIQGQYREQYSTLITEQRRLAEQISNTAIAAASGDIEAYETLGDLTDSFVDNLQVLAEGDPQSGLPALPDSYANEFQAVQDAWEVEAGSVQAIIEGRNSVERVNEYLEQVDSLSTPLRVQTDIVLEQLVETGAPTPLVESAGRQLSRLEQSLSALDQLQIGGGQAFAAADRFAQSAEEFGGVLDQMLTGSGDIPAIDNPQVRESLERLDTIFANVRGDIDVIYDLVPQLQTATQAADNLRGDLVAAARDLDEALRTGEAISIALFIALGFAAAVFLNLVGLAWVMIRSSRKRFEESNETNRRNQRAILRLLDEMATLADGDLSTHATVTEDITGAIADSVNSAIDALRTLVTTINATAEDVARAADRTQSTAIRLAEASNQQAREIAAANEQITDMATSMERVSENARGSAEVALKSVSIASSGAETVRRSISGMDSIREQIQETSKRIKRLGESSQEIGDIIEVINDIAEQTNILALNAAIQASTAGEAGRGFAVVADEVQRLAERATDATKRVEALIKTIQNDTSEAVQSMEQSTAGVVSGAKLAEEAGGALGEIESVSTQIADLIQQISQEAEQQAETAVHISETMNVIQGITIQTSDGTSETATSIGELTELSRDLRASVTGFKLPEELGGESDAVAQEGSV